MAELDSLVSARPGAVALVIVVLLAVSKLMSGIVVWFGKRELGRMWDAQAAHDERLAALEGGDSDHVLILQKLGYISKGLADLTASVTDHNKESEGWKRTIVGHGVRIKNLEARR